MIKKAINQREKTDNTLNFKLLFDFYVSKYYTLPLNIIFNIQRMNYLAWIENKELEKLRLAVLGPDTYMESAEFGVKELSSEEQISLVRKLLVLDETTRPNWCRFIQRYMIYRSISDDAIDILFENMHVPVSFNLIIKILNLQGYSESQGKSLCIFMLHCDDLDRILKLFQLLCLRGREFSMAIYNLLDNLDRRLIKSGYIDLEFFAKTYLQSVGVSVHLFKSA